LARADPYPDGFCIVHAGERVNPRERRRRDRSGERPSAALDAADELVALGVDLDDGLALAKQYLEQRGDGDVEGFVAFVRRRLESAEPTAQP
jgi:hypothetical protein